MLINLNTAIQALQSHDGIGSKEEAIKVLEGLRVEDRDLQPFAVAMLFQSQTSDFQQTKITNGLRLWYGYARSEAEAVGSAITDGQKTAEGMSLSLHVAYAITK
jgi:hypothetical protein